MSRQEHHTSRRQEIRRTNAILPPGCGLSLETPLQGSQRKHQDPAGQPQVEGNHRRRRARSLPHHAPVPVPNVRYPVPTTLLDRHPRLHQHQRQQNAVQVRGNLRTDPTGNHHHAYADPRRQPGHHLRPNPAGRPGHRAAAPHLSGV
uniref:(northern house mosquito) hypothetical protein n=1 Tax=Culex pipiens TaxID=7175 RepID=A0A8D8CTV6_CULPI